jgi:hypothetical protein
MIVPLPLISATEPDVAATVLLYRSLEAAVHGKSAAELPAA